MEAQPKNSNMLTVSEVAYLLHVHPNTVRHWADGGLLNAYRLGTRRDRRFKREDVEGFLQWDGTTGPR
jgi:excisionase family DNA binding protein